MNKKIITIFAVILACICLGFLARNLQNNILKNLSSNSTTVQNQNPSDSSIEQRNQEEKTEAALNNSSEQASKDNGNSEKNNGGGTTTPASPKEPTTTNTPKQNKANFIVFDSVNNKTLFSNYTEYNGESLESITKKLLGTNCVVRGGYFKEMYGLKERGAGPNSGWCFYINNVKSSVGAGSYVPSKDDVIIWKYLSDGLSN